MSGKTVEPADAEEERRVQVFALLSRVWEHDAFDAAAIELFAMFESALRQREQETASECARIARDRSRGASTSGGQIAAEDVADIIERRFPKDQG